MFYVEINGNVCACPPEQNHFLKEKQEKQKLINHNNQTSNIYSNSTSNIYSYTNQKLFCGDFKIFREHKKINHNHNHNNLYRNIRNNYNNKNNNISFDQNSFRSSNTNTPNTPPVTPSVNPSVNTLPLPLTTTVKTSTSASNGIDRSSYNPNLNLKVNDNTNTGLNSDHPYHLNNTLKENLIDHNNYNNLSTDVDGLASVTLGLVSLLDFGSLINSDPTLQKNFLNFSSKQIKNFYQIHNVFNKLFLIIIHFQFLSEAQIFFDLLQVRKQVDGEINKNLFFHLFFLAKIYWENYDQIEVNPIEIIIKSKMKVTKDLVSLPSCLECLNRLDTSVSGLILHPLSLIPSFNSTDKNPSTSLDEKEKKHSSSLKNCRCLTCAIIHAFHKTAPSRKQNNPLNLTASPYNASNQLDQTSISDNSSTGPSNSFSYNRELFYGNMKHLYSTDRSLVDDYSAPDILNLKLICSECPPPQGNDQDYTCITNSNSNTNHTTIPNSNNTSINASSGQVELWVCCVCGHIGCDRYHRSHAIKHFNDSHHPHSINLAHGYIWDYVLDGYVHRVRDRYFELSNFASNHNSNQRNTSIFKNTQTIDNDLHRNNDNESNKVDASQPDSIAKRKESRDDNFDEVTEGDIIRVTNFNDLELENEMVLTKFQSISYYYNSLLTKNLSAQHEFFNQKILELQDSIKDRKETALRKKKLFSKLNSQEMAYLDQIESKLKQANAVKQELHVSIQRLNNDIAFIKEINSNMLNDQMKNSNSDESFCKSPQLTLLPMSVPVGKGKQTVADLHTPQGSDSSGSISFSISEGTPGISQDSAPNLTLASSNSLLNTEGGELASRVTATINDKDRRIASLHKQIAECMDIIESLNTEKK